MEKTWAVVVAHLAERRRLMPEVRIYLLLTVEMTKIKKKRPGMTHFKALKRLLTIDSFICWMYLPTAGRPAGQPYLPS